MRRIRADALLSNSRQDRLDQACRVDLIRLLPS
jgi:hypothetical protein